MIFSIQNNELTYLVEFSTVMMTIYVLESVSGILMAQMDLPIQLWHMIEIMRRGFSEHHQMQVPITQI